jgi:hypothetical protein
MPERHAAQLELCHEHIEGLRADGRHDWQYCDLSAWAWCHDCDYYACDIHTRSRHDGHRFVIEFPNNTTRPGSGLKR